MLTQGLVVNLLLHLYAVHAFPESTQDRDTQRLRNKSRRTDSISSYTDLNDDSLPINGHHHARSHSETQRIRDAEAFELEGLISEDDEDHHGRKEADDDSKEEGLARTAWFLLSFYTNFKKNLKENAFTITIYFTAFYFFYIFLVIYIYIYTYIFLAAQVET